MDYKSHIEKEIRARRSLYDLSGEVFILGPTSGFAGWEEHSFPLISEIASFFSVSVRAVHFCGSAKLGFSPVKLSDFREGYSDLDVAILDSHCFRRLHELVLIETNQLRDRTKFPWFWRDQQRVSGYNEFTRNVSRGVFRPDLMPNVLRKAEIRTFFQDLSRKHRVRFKSISACVYLSDVSFNLKQADALRSFAEQKGFL